MIAKSIFRYCMGSGMIDMGYDEKPSCDYICNVMEKCIYHFVPYNNNHYPQNIVGIMDVNSSNQFL